MSLRYRGSLISSTAPTIAPGSAQSIWALQEQYQAQASSLWPPSGVGFDEYFENVILLLPGNGTNGAQNNTFLDSSANNFTITRNGNTTQGTFSPFSKADGRWGNYFNGSSDWLQVAANTAFAFGTGNFTIEGWVYVAAVPNTYNTIFDGRTSGTSITGVWLSIGSGRDIILRDNGGNYLTSGGVTIALNTWNHIAVDRNSTTLRLYLNGVVVGSVTNSTNFTDNNCFLNRVNDVTTLNGTQFISNFRIVKGASVYNGAFTPPTTPLGATSGGTTPPTGTQTSLLTCQSYRFIDNSTNAFAITRNGDVAVTTFSPFPTLTAYAAGTNGGSGYFDGTGDYLTTPSSSQFAPAGDFTIGIWFYPTSLAAAYSAPLGNFTGNNSTDWLIEVTSAGVLNIYTNGSTVRIASSSGAIKANQWQYIAVCRSGSTITAYLNGTSVGTYSQSGTFGSASKAIGIGARTDTQSPVTGYISSVILLDGTVTTTVPSAPSTAVSGTSLLCNFTNAGIIDTSMSNNLETVNQAQISNTQSKFGGTSIYFDGTDDNIVIPYNTIYSLGAGDFTVEGWFYFSNLSTTARGIVALGDGANGGGPYNAWSLRYLGSEGSNQLEFYRYDGTGYNYTTSGLTLSADTWYHIAVSRSSGTLRIFVNGTSYYSATVTLSFNAVNTNPLRIALQYYGPAGGYGGPRYWNGYIDDLRITKGVGRYTSNFTAPSVQFNGFGN